MSDAVIHDRSIAATASQPSSPRIRVAFRGYGFQPTVFPLVGWISFALLIGIWQLASARGWVSPTFLPGPLAIAKGLVGLAESGRLWKDVSASLIRIGAGWSIGTIVGLAVGVTMGLFSVMRSIWTPAISAFYPVPKIALLPLIVLWLGIGEASKIITIAAGVFFPTAIATYSSIDSVPRNLIRMSQSFGVPLFSIITKTLFPGAMPGILAGMRISVATGLLTVVAAEMIGAQEGVGAFVLLQGNLMRSDLLLAGVVVISVLGLSAGIIISAMEKALFRWR